MGQTSQDLQRAYDILEERGWCQGHHTNPGGQVCLEGALVMATEEYITNGWDLHTASPTAVRRYDNSRHAIQRVGVDEGLLDPLWPAIFDWNDRLERTVEDVKLILKKSIEYAEEQGL